MLAMINLVVDKNKHFINKQKMNFMQYILCIHYVHKESTETDWLKYEIVTYISMTALQREIIFVKLHCICRQGVQSLTYFFMADFCQDINTISSFFSMCLDNISLKGIDLLTNWYLNSLILKHIFMST